MGRKGGGWAIEIKVHREKLGGGGKGAIEIKVHRKEKKQPLASSSLECYSLI